MKQCPQCGTQYSDVTLSFCLHDGTPLVVAPQTDTPTVVLGEEETVAARRGAVRVPIGDPNSGTWGQSQVTHVAAVQPQPEKKGSNMAIAVVLTAVGMLVIFGVIGIAAFILWPRPQPIVTNVNNLPNSNVTGLNTNYNYSTPYGAASPVRTTSASTPQASPVTTPPVRPPALSSYPSTTRLRFGRGAYSTSFSGDLNPGDTRSLVLACRSGQSLSANISGSGCVNIRGGGSSFTTTTRGGDNYVTVVSTCSTVARFTITISVI